MVAEPAVAGSWKGKAPAAARAAGRRATAQVRQAVALLRAASAAVGAAEPGGEALGAAAIDPAALGELVGLFATAGRVAEAATVRCARALGDDGCRRMLGRRGEAALVAEVTGTSLARAKQHLEAAAHTAEVPGLAGALAAGEVSCDQLVALAPVLAEDPGAAPALLEAAGTLSLSGLRQLAARHARHGRCEADQVAHEARLHARRRCRVVRVPGEGVRLEAHFGVADGAAVLAALDAETDRLFRCAAIPEPRERLAADALVLLVTGGATARRPQPGRGQPGGPQPGGPQPGPRPEVRVRVDAAALARGELDGDEVCEVAGVGEISLRAAKALLGDALVRVLVLTGGDVRTISSPTRLVPRRLRVALEERDPTCVVPGCTADHHLEIDHWRTDFALGGRTELDNLCRLCPTHHRLKTVAGWRLAGGPGRWRWLAPRARPG